MNILFFAPRFPYPAFKGDQVRAYNQLHELAQRHRITLVTFADASVTDAHRAHMQQFCERVITVPHRHSDIVWLARGMLSSLPMQTVLYSSREMQAVLNGLLSAHQFDLVHVQLARVAHYFEHYARLPRVLDFVDALSVNMQRRAQQERNLIIKIGAHLEANRLRAYEAKLCSAYDQAVIVSQSDRAEIGDFANLSVVPLGVDTTQFAFAPATSREENLIMFSGNMSYFPNINAITWFIKNVLPHIWLTLPSARLEIIGINPTAEIQALARHDSRIHVAGKVSDIAQQLTRASIAIAPMQAGSGIQFKVLEAMACGTPVIATSLAIQGIEAEANKHLLVADTVQDFANQVVRLLSDSALRAHLSECARDLIKTHYTWAQSISALEAVYEKALAGRHA